MKPCPVIARDNYSSSDSAFLMSSDSVHVTPARATFPCLKVFGSLRLSENPSCKLASKSSTRNRPKRFQADVKNQMLLLAVKHDVKSYA